MVRFVAVAQTLQDVDGLRQGWLVDHNLLKTTSKGSVFFEVLAVLVESGCTNGLKLATGKHGLQDRSRVDCTFGCTGTNQGVNLIDEGDDVTARANLFGYFLETLFEITAVA